jgi:hypothetical protein
MVFSVGHTVDPLYIYCGGVQWHPLNYHLTRTAIVPVRGLSMAFKLTGGVS